MYRLQKTLKHVFWGPGLVFTSRTLVWKTFLRGAAIAHFPQRKFANKDNKTQSNVLRPVSKIQSKYIGILLQNFPPKIRSSGGNRVRARLIEQTKWSKKIQSSIKKRVLRICTILNDPLCTSMWGLKLNVPWSLITIQIPYCKSLKLLLPLVAGSRKLLVRELSSADSVSLTLRVSTHNNLQIHK